MHFSDCLLYEVFNNLCEIVAKDFNGKTSILSYTGIKLNILVYILSNQIKFM